MRDEPKTRVRDALSPSWDELRSARVLGQVLEGRRVALARRTAIRRVSMALSAASMAAGLWLAVRPTESEEPKHDALASQDASILTFVEGSQAILSGGASVETEREDRGEVRLRQRSGSVRYRIRPDRSRPFVVRARTVEVLVLGTVFTVDVEPDAVSVGVEEGRVRVLDGGRRLELGPGEDIRIAASPAVASATSPEERATAVEVPSEEAPSDRRLPSRTRAPDPVEELLAVADAARKDGRLDEAERALATIVRQHRRDLRVVSALFTLGRVERARARHEKAARAFEECRARSPRGPLAEDALAEEAESWANARKGALATNRAREYLERYPAGTHVARMRTLID